MRSVCGGGSWGGCEGVGVGSWESECRCELGVRLRVEVKVEGRECEWGKEGVGARASALLAETQYKTLIDHCHENCCSEST